MIRVYILQVIVLYCYLLREVVDNCNKCITVTNDSVSLQCPVVRAVVVLDCYICLRMIVLGDFTKGESTTSGQ